MMLSLLWYSATGFPSMLSSFAYPTRYPSQASLRVPATTVQSIISCDDTTVQRTNASVSSSGIEITQLENVSSHFVGTVKLPLTYDVQFPHDLLLCQRYAQISELNFHDFLISKHDKPYQIGSKSAPRTELRIMNNDMYNTGIYVYSSEFRLTCTSSGVIIFQVCLIDTIMYIYC